MTRIVSIVVLLALLAACGKPAADSESEAKRVYDDDGEFDPNAYKRKKIRPFVRQRPKVKVGDDNPAPKADSKKKPLLFYYAVDTEEPFMQAAADYEVRGLRAVCNQGDKEINWVAYLNSHYVHNEKLFLVCKGGQYSEKRLTNVLERIIVTLTAEDYDPRKPKKGYIALDQDKRFNALYARYPYAHPEVLSAVLRHTVKLFDPKDYEYFVHFKSHGAEGLLLSGLSERLLVRKTERQKEVLDEYLDKVRKAALKSDKDIDLRNRVACEAKGATWKGTACYCEATKKWINQFFGECSRTPGRAGLGTVKLGELGLDRMGLGVAEPAKKFPDMVESLGWDGMGWDGMGWDGMGWDGMGWDGMGWDGMGWDGMGWDGMGWDGMGFSDLGEYGLGLEDGLGADNFFGTSNEAMEKVLSRAISRDKIDFGFIVFESCESRISRAPALKKALEHGLKGIDGYYSADGSLWYRNIDWHVLLRVVAKIHDNDPEKLVDLVGEWTQEITTYVKKESDEDSEGEE